MKTEVRTSKDGNPYNASYWTFKKKDIQTVKDLLEKVREINAQYRNK
jgi:hypothetical protein